MKKLFALILAVVMICAMSVNVFAERVIGGSDGVADFSDKGVTVNAEISATAGDVANRYAIDIEYTAMTFNISGAQLVWDVNKLEYVSADPDAVAGNREFPVQVINYSDRPVNLTVNCQDIVDDDGVTVACDLANNTYKLEDAIGHTVDSVKANDADTQKSFKVSVTSTDWVAVGNYYAAKFAGTSQNTITAGTLTLTIAKVS